MSILLNGKELAKQLRQELALRVAELSFPPKLGVILVGDDPASHLYVALKEKAASEVGIEVEKTLLPAKVSTQAVIAAVEKYNTRPDIHGLLVQLPLPTQINEQAVIAAINPHKDADGFHPENLAKLQNNVDALKPGVSQGIIKLIELVDEPLAGKKALLLVNSREFALPLAKMLAAKEVEVEVIRAPQADKLLTADIMVVALGKPKVLSGQWIKNGAIVIDVGTTKINDKIVGDVDADSLKDRNIFLTPVPGGVGPMTVIMLLWNVYHLARRLA